VGLSAPLGGASSDRGIHSREEAGKEAAATARSRADCQLMQLPQRAVRRPHEAPLRQSTTTATAALDAQADGVPCAAK